jgi:hypothetical protein
MRHKVLSASVCAAVTAAMLVAVAADMIEEPEKPKP